MRFNWDNFSRYDFEDYKANIDEYMQQEFCTIGGITAGPYQVWVNFESIDDTGALSFTISEVAPEQELIWSTGGYLDGLFLDASYESFVDILEEQITQCIKQRKERELGVWIY